MMFFLSLLFLLVHLASSSSSSSHADVLPPTCHGSPNTLPFYTSPPTLIKSIPPYLSVYTVGDITRNSSMKIVHLFGNGSSSDSYEMGRAYGSFFAEELKYGLNTLFDEFIQTELESIFPKLPKWLAELIEDVGLFPALEILWEMEKKYTPLHFGEMMRGIADGSGVEFKRVLGLNMMPEAIHAGGCTMIGAFGSSTKSGQLQQLRALDLDPMPLLYDPTVYVYHWGDGSNPVAIFAGPAYVGFLSGIAKIASASSSAEENDDDDDAAYLGLSEKVWISAGLPIYVEKFGISWSLDLFDVLRYSKSVEEGVKRMRESKRTVSVFAGLGSSLTPPEFDVVHYNAPGYGDFAANTWETQPTYEHHPRIEDVAYLDKHKQPSNDPCLPAILSALLAKKTPLSAEKFVREVAPVHETGDLQVVAWDFHEKKSYVSMSVGPGDAFAYEKQYVVLDIEKDLFGVSMRT